MERCKSCRKKALITVKCKCLATVCLTCRQPELHSCTFDYHAEAQELVKKLNPIILSKKVDKI
jgi:AN1-type zinc finger protein 5/6